MKYKRLPDKEKTTIIKRIEVEGITLNATPDLYELLDKLESCDGYFTRLTIDGDIGEKLEKLGVVSRNIKGSYSPKYSNKLKELKHIVCKVVYEDD